MFWAPELYLTYCYYLVLIDQKTCIPVQILCVLTINIQNNSSGFLLAAKTMQYNQYSTSRRTKHAQIICFLFFTFGYCCLCSFKVLLNCFADVSLLYIYFFVLPPKSFICFLFVLKEFIVQKCAKCCSICCKGRSENVLFLILGRVGGFSYMYLHSWGQFYFILYFIFNVFTLSCVRAL